MNSINPSKEGVLYFIREFSVSEFVDSIVDTYIGHSGHTGFYNPRLTENPVD